MMTKSWLATCLLLSTATCLVDALIGSSKVTRVKAGKEYSQGDRVDVVVNKVG